MKKTLLALAVLAASGASFAQSSVTLYGYGDFGIGRDIGNDKKLQFNPNAADVGGIRLGMKGSEDLGGGLKANFNLETDAINADTGAASSVNGGYGRATWVGLSGGFGEVKLGRQARQAVIVAVGFVADKTWRGTAADLNAGLRYSINDNLGASSRMSSQISYTTPTIAGGLVGRVGYVLPGENNSTVSTSSVDAGVTYYAGPIGLGLAYIKASGKESNYGLHASYDFGAARVMGSYQVVGAGNGATAAVAAAGTAPAVAAFAGNVQQKGFTLGVSAPMGATTLFAEASRNTTSKVNSVELGADYNLSKRTALTVAMNKTTDLGAGYFAGVRHAF